MLKPDTAYDAIVIGGGAAGLMCAIQAGRRGRRVLLVEHNDAVGKKIRISGGGRCNFTNIHTDPSRFISENPRFCYSALSKYSPQDFIAYVEGHRIPYHEKKLGQLFCDGSAQAIIDALLADCAAENVKIRLNCEVLDVRRSDRFTVETSQGPYIADALVVATGGLSIPKLGASDLGYRIAQQFGLRIVPCAPALVPFTLPAAERESLSGLSGVSFEATVSCNKVAFEENVLITHRGMSGPAILQISSYWTPGLPVEINILPQESVLEELLRTKREMPGTAPKNFLGARLPARFAQYLCECYRWNRNLGEMADSELRAMADVLQKWKIEPAGTEGYAKAEVTRGGVDTRQLSPKTMEARDVPGLYIIGEVMDVTGWLGGYNFQWAWASAVAAGQSI